MTTRFNSGDPFGVPSGYEGANTPDDLVMPSCGLEDVDKALFDTFNSDIKFVVSNGPNREAKKVPVIFAVGERWAMLKRGRALRDKTGSLILPLITIRRTNFEQNMTLDITGRGINQQTGELVIKRRLSSKDRAYQSVINKLGLKNQDNVSDNTATLSTLRKTESLADDPDIRDGGLLAPKNKENIWEVITIPAPQFFTATYEVTFWTQYSTHMNQVLEKLLASFLPQGQALRLDTPKGYWFVGYVEGNQFNSEDNADEMTQEERLVKYKFVMKVPGYVVASNTPGTPVPVRKFISAPQVSFSLGIDDGEELASGFPVSNPNEGADDPTRGFSLDGSIQPREKATTQAENNTIRIVRNPFTGQDQVQYVRIVTRNSKTGESVMKPADGFVIKIV